MSQQQATSVKGVRLSAVEAGIKKANRRDLVVFELAKGARTAAVFTQNRFCAAPVQIAKKNLATIAPRYLMINTGYANAGTGETGLRNCLESCRLLASQAGCSEEEVLPFSTGVIGEQFPLEAFERGLPLSLSQLSEMHWQQAAEGIMTTDTKPKLVSRNLMLQGVAVTVTGISKGAGMIKPNMATMLGFIATDAAVAQPLLEQWIRELADASFNRITIDGDTSTNDACLLIASGAAGMETEIADAESSDAQELLAVLKEVFVELAHAIVRDGEGATKFVEIEVRGAQSDADARVVAETVAHSPLVKTALFASDPNWGRILAAIGRAPIAELEVDKVSICIGNVQIVELGAVAAKYRESLGAAAMQESDITIRIELGNGEGRSVIWTCDFSYDYVKINAEYRS